MPLVPPSQDSNLDRLPLVVALALAGLMATCALVLWVLLYVGLATGFNQRGLISLHQAAPESLAPMAIALTRSGSLVAVAAYALLFVAARAIQGRGADAVALGVTVVGAAASVAGIKPIVHEARPHLFAWIFPDTGYAFPSGHTTMSFALAAFLSGWLLRERPPSRGVVAAAMLLMLWAALVGVSRLYLGVHWPIDVLASACIGIAWACAGHACRFQLYPPPASTTRSQS